MSAGDSRDLRRSWLPWIPLFVVLALALAVGAVGARGPSSNEERSLAIARTIKCPICQGETVAESNVDMSVAIRTEIARQVEAGQSDDDIRRYFEEKYPGILLTPPSGGVGGLVWILPVVAFAVAVFFLVVVFRRWSSEEPVHATDEDRALVEQALEQAHARTTGTPLAEEQPES